MYVWDGVAVWDGVLVESSVVSARSPVPGLLGDHVERRCPVAGGQPDDVQVEHVFKLFLGYLEVFKGAIRRVLADTGCPVVVILCVTSCLTGLL